MTTLRTTVKKYYQRSLLVTAFLLSGFELFRPSASAATTTIQDCSAIECIRFHTWGYSMDIARHGKTLKAIMDITHIDTPGHTAESFKSAIDSNWGPHITGTEFSEHKVVLQTLMQQLGMYNAHSELIRLPPGRNRLYVIVLGGHPSQLCKFLADLSLVKQYIHHFVLIGSSGTQYESRDYLNCPTLNSSQLEELRNTRETISEKEVMSIYFNDFDTFFPIFSENQQGEIEGSFTNNQHLRTFLKHNRIPARSHQSIVIAAPQPYMPEAMSILRRHSKNLPIYRISNPSGFSVYESLNALRSWLRTDYSLTQQKH